jgi:hypothetical protein
LDEQEHAVAPENLPGNEGVTKALGRAFLLSLLLVGCADTQKGTVILPPSATTSPDERPPSSPPPASKPPAQKGSSRAVPAVAEEEPGPKPAAPQAVPLLSPDVSEKEKMQSEQEAMTKIRQVEQRVAQIDHNHLTKQQQDTLLTIQSFLSKAEEAISLKDVPRAFNLAEKAQTLVGELPNVSDPLK